VEVLAVLKMVVIRQGRSAVVPLMVNLEVRWGPSFNTASIPGGSFEQFRDLVYGQPRGDGASFIGALAGMVDPPFWVPCGAGAQAAVLVVYS
jgi:hypothetical protein